MMLEVHVAYLFASLSVLFGLTYSMTRVLDYKIKEAQARKQKVAREELETAEDGVLVL